MKNIVFMTIIILIMVLGFIVYLAIPKIIEKRALGVCLDSIGDSHGKTEVLIQYCIQGEPQYNYICSDGTSPQGFKGFIGSDFKFYEGSYVGEEIRHPCDNNLTFGGTIFNEINYVFDEKGVEK